MSTQAHSTPEDRPAPAGDPALDAELTALGNDLGRAFASARRALHMEARRLHLVAVETYFRAAFYLCMLGFGLTASVSAALFVVSGVRGALAAWSGAQWVGELGSGLVVIAIVILGGLAVREHLLRDIARRARHSLEVGRAARAAQLAARGAQGGAAVTEQAA